MIFSSINYSDIYLWEVRHYQMRQDTNERWLCEYTAEGEN